jgi:PAS domain S-box-containing protein
VIVRWNPAAERILGYTVAETLGRTFEKLIVPESARGEVREVCRLLAAVEQVHVRAVRT